MLRLEVTCNNPKIYPTQKSQLQKFSKNIPCDDECHVVNPPIKHVIPS